MIRNVLYYYYFLRFPMYNFSAALHVSGQEKKYCWNEKEVLVLLGVSWHFFVGVSWKFKSFFFFWNMYCTLDHMYRKSTHFFFSFAVETLNSEEKKEVSAFFDTYDPVCNTCSKKRKKKGLELPGYPDEKVPRYTEKRRTRTSFSVQQYFFPVLKHGGPQKSCT